MVNSTMNNLDPQYEQRLITRSFLRYIGPALVSLLFAQIAPVVDAFCIAGKIGDDALSAISVVSPVYYFFNVIGVMTGIGAGVTIAKAAGTGDRDKAGRAFTRVLIFTIAVSVIVSGVLFLMMDPLLLFLSATPENMAYCRDYLRILLIGMVFYVLNMSGAYILTDDNNPNLAMAGGQAETSRDSERQRLIDRRIKTGVEEKASAEFVDFSDMPNVRLCLEHSKKADLTLELDSDGDYNAIELTSML